MSYEELLKKAKKGLVSLDAEALVDCYAPVFLLDDTASGNQIEDKSDLREYYDRLFSLPEVVFTDVSFFSLGKKAAGEWTWRGINSSGKKFTIRGASLFKLGEDGIQEEILFYDPRLAIE